MCTMDHGTNHRRLRDTGISAERKQQAFIFILFYSLFYINDLVKDMGGRGNMSDLKASGRKGGFQSLRRTLGRPHGASMD